LQQNSFTFLMKKHNFGAGPSILPRPVYEKGAEAILDFNYSGVSLLEMSHRSPEIVDIMQTARNLVLELAQLQGKGYQVLFLQGGASLQFAMVAANLLQNKAAYLNTGTWANNAIQEARFYGEVTEVASSKDQNYNYIPKGYSIPDTADYFHITSNNTIYGTQLHQFPSSPIPVVCDMSSDIFSRQLDYSYFSLIYAGAQKNIGPSGVAVVIIKEEILSNRNRSIPNILNYQAHIDKESMYHTPAVLGVYLCLQNLEYLKSIGGIETIEKINRSKAEMLYAEIDRNSLFQGHAVTEDRSFMNVTFTLTYDRLQERFNNLAQEAGIIGINGHRTVGGYRASIYNALPLESVQVLVEVMQHLEKTA
jgi:phosphoserine aminotransferase